VCSSPQRSRCDPATIGRRTKRALSRSSGGGRPRRRADRPSRDVGAHRAAREKQAFAGPVDGTQLARIRELCSRRGVYCLAGSIAERASDGRVYNTTALLSPRGEIAATYRKLHLFDVDIPDGARYRESEQVAPGDAAPRGGDQPRPQDWPLRLLRPALPELYRDAGADLLCVPAAFTAYTGRAHWEVLLRRGPSRTRPTCSRPRRSAASVQRARTDSLLDTLASWIPGGSPGGRRRRAGRARVASIHLERLSQVRRDLPALQHRRRDVL